MEQTSAYSEQFLRKRKMMLMIPLLIVPMACLAFYGLGGGRGGSGATAAGPQLKGLNMTLPLAHIDGRNQPTDKLGFYEKAKLDSMRLQERRKQDPYALGNKNPFATKADSLSRDPAEKRPGEEGIGAIDPGGSDRQADQVMEKLDQLKQVLGKSGPGFGQEGIGSAGGGGSHGEGVGSGGASGGHGVRPGFPVGQAGLGAQDFDTSAAGRTQQRIREMMERLKAASPGGEDDPEMDRLDGMLDKLIKIQHPGLVHGDTSAAPGAPPTALVSPQRNDVPVGTLPSVVSERDNVEAFMEIGVRDEGDSAKEVAIEAVINSDQTLTAGSTVALRIVQDFTVGSEHIAANQLVYGVAALAGERLTIGINSIRVGQSIIAVSMQVYDLDGLPGIRIPGAITRDVSKASADQALSGLEMASVNPSLGAQAAGAGMEFARSLASRKIRLVRVSLPAGYRVLLKNGKSITH